MKFFIQNEEIDRQVKEIRHRIFNTKNGVVADSMKDKGVVYKRNWGVDILRLKEIAQKYMPNHELAKRLWAMQIRETMILAMMLQPIENFNQTMADEWVEDVANIELAEQITMNLLSKLPYSAEYALKLINSNDFWKKVTGFTLVARIWKNFDEKQVEEIIKHGYESSNSNEFLLYKSVAVALARMCRRNEQTSKDVLCVFNKLEASNCMSEKYIFNEIKNEISFLNF